MINKPLYYTTALVVMAVACGESQTGVESFAQAIAIGDDFEDFPQSRSQEVVDESMAAEIEDYERDDEGTLVQERFVCSRKTVSVWMATELSPCSIARRM